MRMRTLCAFTILFYGTAAPQTPPVAVSRTIKALSEQCAAAGEYAFEGELLLEGQRGAAPGKLLSKARVKVAVAPQGKYFLKLEPFDKDEYVLVSNGQKSWAFVPKLKQYTEEESAAATDGDAEDGGGERDLAETYARLVMPTLARLYRTAQAADQNGYATVKYAGRKQSWPVLRVMSKPDEREGTSLTEITLDPETLAVGRMVWSNMTRNEGVKTLLRLTVDFTSFHPGVKQDDSTYVFEPPKSAKLTDAVPIPGQTGSFLLNQSAPDFELKTLEGEKIRLAGLRGRTVLLSFWASWCGPCRRELPHLVALHQELKDKGLVVLGINDQGKGAARRYINEAGLSFPTLDDSGLKAHRLYRVHSIPSLFLIDGDGKVVRFFKGAQTEATLRKALSNAGLPAAGAERK